MVNSWRQMITGDGCPTLLHPVHGEPCHDTRGAWAEAMQLHVFGCDLPRRLLRGENLRLLDVGSAPGWNLAAACSVAGLLPGSLEVTAVERSEEALAAGLELSSEMSWRAGAPSGAGSALELAHSGLRAARGAADGGWDTVALLLIKTKLVMIKMLCKYIQFPVRWMITILLMTAAG